MASPAQVPLGKARKGDFHPLPFSKSRGNICLPLTKMTLGPFSVDIKWQESLKGKMEPPLSRQFGGGLLYIQLGKMNIPFSAALSELREMVQ